MDSNSSPSQSRRAWRRFLGRSATGHPTQQLTPTRPGGKRPTNPVDSATQDSARGLRVANKKAPRRDVVLGSGGNRAAAGVVTNLGASLAKVQRDTPRSSGRDATGTFEEMLPPPGEEAVAEAYNRIGLGAHVSGAVEAVVNGMKNLWARATRQKARIFKHKAEAECEAWARLDAVDQDLVVLAADDAANCAKAYAKKVGMRVTLRVADVDAADRACARFLERAQNAQTATTLVLIGGRAVKIIKKGKTGTYSVELLGADTDGRGNAGDRIKVNTNELVQGQDNLAPTQKEIRESSCNRLGITMPRTITVANIAAFGKRVAEVKAEATETAHAEVAGELFDEGNGAFVAACKAALTRTDLLLLVEKRSLELSCLPKRAITGPRCELIAVQAGSGSGYTKKALTLANKCPDGFTPTQSWPKWIYCKAQDERNEQPAIDRLHDLVCRRTLGLIRAAHAKEAKLFKKMKGKAPMQEALADEPCDVGALDECEAAFDRAEATRKGPRHTIASRRWCLPLCPSIKLEASADDLRKCPEFLIPFDEDDFDSLEEVVARMEMGARLNPYLYPSQI